METNNRWKSIGIRIVGMAYFGRKHSFFFKNFKGQFWGEYNHDYRPPRIFNNSKNCKPFVDFINNTIYERLCDGSIKCLGKVGCVEPPRIVAPLTMEPSKPRLYLNNCFRDNPFKLDTLKDVPRVTKCNAFFTSLDDKSCFDNVLLNPDSYDLVGFQWGGY